MRVKHAAASRHRKKKAFKAAKGFWGDRSRKYRRVAETLRRAGVYAYRDRRTKKRNFRYLWITRINAAALQRGTSYHELIHGLKLKKILLSRDMLAKIAAEYPEIFDRIVETVKAE